ncbi:MAG: hypothetical protein LUF85_10695 [Bacteroides sp.]|nr:hypothetical protein [Bacteroides sp.]
MKTRLDLLFLSATLFGVAACDDLDSHASTNILETPVVTVPEVKETSAVVTWAEVANATAYIYSVDGGPEQTTSETTLQLTDLEPEKTYSFQVKAQRTGSLYFEDSPYAEISFTTTSHVTIYRVATFADDWDTWYYEYNTDGKVSHVYRLTADGEIDREWLFAYSGLSLEVTGRDTYAITLNEEGYAATMDDGANQYVYTYQEGYLVQVERDGEPYSNIEVENGNIMKWSRFTEGVEQFKLHTYGTVPNVGGAHCVYSERAGISRWLAETGLFGKPSALCHTSNVWDHSGTSSFFTFVYDTNGCIQQEIKDYDGYIENFFYTYYVE